MCQEALLKKISQTREQMILVANEKGMNHQEAIKISTELDSLLNCYQKIINKQI